MSEYLQKIVYLTESQYAALGRGEKVGNQTGLNDNYIYMTDGKINLIDIDSSFILPVNRGGTGATSWASGKILVGNGSDTFTTIDKTPNATANTLVERNSSGGFSAGTVTVVNTAGFTYSGIESASTNASRNVWFSDANTVGRPVYNNNFKYNPSTTALTIDKLTITGGTTDSTLVSTNNLTLSTGSGKTLTLNTTTISTVGKITSPGGIVLSATDSDKASISFSRTTANGGPNYINVPTNGELAVSVGGIAGANIRFRVSNTTVDPYTTNTVDLGKTDVRWKNLYLSGTAYATAFEGNLTGIASSASKLTNTAAIGSDVKPVYFTANGIPQATATEMIRGFTTADAGTDLNTMVNSGMYGITGGTLSNQPNGGSNYATILTVAYRKPSGNTKSDYAWQMGNFTQDNDRLWYRTSQANSWRAWRQVVNIATNTGVGGSNTPIYVTADGEVKSCNSYGGGTAITLNGTPKTASTASFYAPTSSGSAGQVLISDGASKTPVWKTKRETGLIYDWTAVIQGQKWSRICYIPYSTSITGTSFLLNIRATRSSVVYNYTFIINVHHSSKCHINVLQGNSYTTIKIRGIVDSNGNVYIELYDDANSIASGTTQNVSCHLQILTKGSTEPTLYTTFTDGTTLPSGFTAYELALVNKGGFQTNGQFTGNLVGNADTATGISTTGGSAAKFWRGDNTWSNTISGGLLNITNNSNTLTIGAQNASYCHFANSANIPFHFNKKISDSIGFEIYDTSNNWQNGYLKINNKDGDNVYLELARQNNADWRILNSGGNLYIQSDYTNAKTSYYNVLTLAYNTGNAIFKGNITADGNIGAANSFTVQKAIFDMGASPITAGWRRVCKVSTKHKYQQWFLGISGDYSSSAPAGALIAVTSRHTTINPILLSGIVATHLDKIRFINISANQYWLDIYCKEFPNNSNGNQIQWKDISFYFWGDVVVSDIQTSLDINTSTGGTELTLRTMKDQPTFTLQDNDGTNSTTSTFTHNDQILKLPSTIKASLTGNAATTTAANLTTTTNAIAKYSNTTGTFANSGVTIDGNNNVTIPGSTLKITNTSGGKYILLGNQDSSGVNCPVIFTAANGGLRIGNGTDWSSDTGGTLNVAIYMGKDRKIGIGTTSPSYALSVNGDVSATNFRGVLVGNADTATQFNSAASIELIGDTTGSASSAKGWSVATTTKFLSGTNFDSDNNTALTTHPGAGKISYAYNIRNTTGLFDIVTGYSSNSILTLSRHNQTNYTSQLGFSSNGRIYYRSFNGTALDNSTTWNKIAWVSDITASAVGLNTWTGSSNISTVGTITSGTWQGSVISSTYIGSHTHSYAASSSAGGAATYAATTADTSNVLYPIGVTSAATTTLKRDTSITMQGGIITASTYKVTANATITYNTTSGCIEIIV